MSKPKFASFFVIVLCLLSWRATAGEKFVWEPITATDWSVTEDSAKGIREAVIIFEKMIADDRKLDADKCYLTIYRRLKIFNAEGRKWGDVIAPYLHKRQKIEEIQARTVLPSGQEIPLLETQIFEKEILKTEGFKIKQKSFSLSGITDGCIIEYYLKYRLPVSNSQWLVQKDIALLQGEYRWLFYRGRGLTQFFYALLAGGMVPNYLWLNHNATAKSELRPSEKDPREVFITIRDVAPFKKEPYSPPAISQQTQLRCYYGAKESWNYWSIISESLSLILKAYCEKNKRVKEIVASFGNLSTTEEKIQKAYIWCQKNIQNVDSLRGDNGLKGNVTADETIKRGYGSPMDISVIFYNMLHEMNIPARLAYVVNRDENFFVEEAKYWQFDGILVAIPVGENRYRFLSPGDLYLPPSHVPWFNEGVKAMVIDEEWTRTVEVPFSSPDMNRFQRTMQLRLSDDLKLAGKLKEQHWGQSSRSLRLSLTQTPPAERQEKLRKKLEGELPNAVIDSIAVAGIDSLRAPVSLAAPIRISEIKAPIGSRWLLQPFIFMDEAANPFQAETRRQPIMFDYAYVLTESLRVDLPASWKVEALPEKTFFANDAGRFVADFTTDGNSVTVEFLFRLKNPLFPVSSYALVRRLFQARQELNNLTIVLKKDEIRAAKQ
jgi:hypothetical protein